MTPADPRPAPADLPWRKSTYSNAGNQCVEVAQSGPTLLIRDSKNLASPPLRLSRNAWFALVNDIRRQAHVK